jgi:Cof subfamily protein (haloacid dehalogenase superfamily)
MYRLLAVDLDGTLLRADKHVDPRDIAAIREARRAGVTITIVTGRLHSGSEHAARACGIDGAIGCVEGSHLVEAETGRTLRHHPMAPEVTSLLRDTFGNHELASFVFDADAIHHDHDGAPFADYVRTWSPNLKIVDEALAEAVWGRDPLAAVAIGEPAAVTAAAAALRPHADRVFAVSFEISWCPGTYAVMVRAAGPSKGSALVELCAAAGCTPADAVAVGDWFNDVPMFEVAGRSFAMGTAPPSVQAKATDVLDTPAGAGGGIAEAVRRAWG